ncbi:MAG: glycosyltransferase 87 family protein [Acidobacteriota bacterium]|nr:glycosyltransferase 87 family protein [Acidobacteriota bacterium]MDE3260853.1 glycosyltransferase 87 family protein [Acidobacteriota bacterium]
MSWRSLAALGGFHVLLAGVLATVLETAAGFWWHLGTHALLFVPLLLVVAPALRAAVHPGRRQLVIVLAAAALSRVLLLPTTPVLSGDVYRMAWEGQVVLDGKDPWAQPPDDPALAGLAAAHPELRERVGYWKLPAIYPPFAQLFGAGAGWISPSVTVLKAALLLAEAALIAALLALLSSRGHNPLLVAAYAWNPLPLTEIAGSGHGDALAVAFLFLALLALERGRAAGAAALAALSGMTKFAGFVLLPFLLRRVRDRRRRRTALGASGAVVLVTLAPFLTPARLTDGFVVRFQEFGFSLWHYARHWRFNDSLFSPLDAVLGGAARPVAFAVLIFLAAALVIRRRPPGLSLALLAGAAFLLSPVAHPWYLLWTLPFLVVNPERRGLLAAGLTMTLTVAFSYYAYWTIPPGLDWTLPAWVRIAEYLPVPLAALVFRGPGQSSDGGSPPDSSRRKCATASAAA